MSQQASAEKTVDQSSSAIDDASSIDAVIAGFIAACAQTLFQTRVEVEKKTPRLSRLTIGLTLVVAVLSSVAAVILFTNGATLLQIVLSSIGEVFLFVMVAMSGLMDLQGNHKRLVKREIEAELSKCQEMATAMSGLVKLRSQWNKSIFGFESQLVAVKKQIDLAGLELEVKREMLDEVFKSIVTARDEHQEVLGEISRSKEEAGVLHQKTDSLNVELAGLKGQVSTVSEQLDEVNVKVNEKQRQLDQVFQEHSTTASDLANLRNENTELRGINQQLMLQRDDLEQNVETLERSVTTLEAMSLELASVEETLVQRRQENDSALLVNEGISKKRQALESDLAADQSKLDQLRSELHQLDSELQHVRSETVIAQQQWHGIAAAIAAQHAQGDELANQLGEVQREIMDLRRVADQLDVDNRQSQQTQVILSRTVDCLRRKSIRYKLRVGQSELLVEQHAMEIQSQLAKRQQIEQYLANLNAQVAEANDDLMRLEPARAELLAITQQKDQLVSALENQYQAIANVTSEIACGQSNLLQIAERTAAMESEANALRVEVFELQSSKSASAIEAERAASDLTTLREELATLAISRQDLIETIERLEVAKQTIEAEAEGLQGHLALLAQQVVDQEIARDRVVAEYSSVVERKASVGQSIVHLEQELQLLRDQYSATEQLQFDLIAQCDDLRELSVEIDEKNRQAADEHSRKIDLQEALNAEISSARAENGRLQMKAVALKAQETSLRGEIAELTLRQERLSHEAAEAENSIADLHGQADRLQESLRVKDAVRLQILKLTEEKQLLTGQVDNVNGELAVLVERTAESSKILDDLSMRIAQANEQIMSHSEVLANHEQELNSKQSLFDSLTLEIEESQARLRSVQDDYQHLLQTREQAESINQKLAAETGRLQQDRQECLQVVEARENAESQLVAIQRQIDDAEVRMNEMNEEIKAGQRKLEQDNSEIEQMMIIKTRLNDELQDSQLRLTEAAKRRDELQDQAETFALRSDGLRLTIGQLEHEVDRLEAVKREGELLRQRNIDLDRELLNKQQSLREAEGGIQTLQQQIETLAGAISKLHEERGEKEADLQHLSLQTESQLQLLSDARRRQETAEQSIADLEGKIADREHDLQHLDRSIEAGLSEKHKLETDLDEMAATVATWNSQADEAQRSLAELDSIRAEQSSLILLIQEEQSALEAKRLQLNEVEHARATAQLELETIQAEVEASRASFDDLRITVSELTDQVQQLTGSKIALEDELLGCESDLEAKQREISTIESRDMLRQSLVTKELEEAAMRLSDTERRLANAKESLRAQEENVSEAVAVSQQWDSYIVSLREKWEELQQANAKSNQELQSVLAEKLRAEGELADAKCRLSESENLADNAQRQLAGIEMEIAVAADRQSVVESSLVEVQNFAQQLQREIDDQQRQVEAHAVSIRATTDEIAEKKQNLSELVIAEGRLIQRCAELEDLIRQAEAAEKANADTVVQVPQRIVSGATMKGNAETTGLLQEDLLKEIETLVVSIDQPSLQAIPMKTEVEESAANVSKALKRTSDLKQSPPDPWASVFE